MLPFKGDINQNELNILNKISAKNKTNELNATEYDQEAYEDDWWVNWRIDESIKRLRSQMIDESIEMRYQKEKEMG